MSTPEDRRPRPEEPPEYTRYRSRRSLLPWRDRDDPLALSKLRGDRARKGPTGARGGFSWGRVARYLLAAAAVWVLVSVLALMISAQIQQGKLEDAVNRQLGGGGYPLTSANNILVLGSDTRPEGSDEPGAQTSGPGRSDSIMLMRVGGGANSRLSIARDTLVDIPGAGRQKINAAYAIGGAALAVQTVENYTGVDIHHIVIVSFDEFPGLIDAMGGVTYRGGCVVSRINGGFRNGGYTLRLPAGKSKIDGKQALALARTRKNDCNRKEDDLTRAKRQQKIFSAMRRRMISPGAFIRLPLIAWEAPKAVRSDMSGPSLLGLFGALSIGGQTNTEVLGTISGEVPENRRRAAVKRFLRG